MHVQLIRPRDIGLSGTTPFGIFIAIGFAGLVLLCVYGNSTYRRTRRIANAQAIQSQTPIILEQGNGYPRLVIRLATPGAVINGIQMDGLGSSMYMRSRAANLKVRPELWDVKVEKSSVTGDDVEPEAWLPVAVSVNEKKTSQLEMGMNSAPASRGFFMKPTHKANALSHCASHSRALDVTMLVSMPTIVRGKSGKDPWQNCVIGTTYIRYDDSDGFVP